jgi:hypothetical protein
MARDKTYLVQNAAEGAEQKGETTVFPGTLQSFSAPSTAPVTAAAPDRPRRSSSSRKGGR